MGSGNIFISYSQEDHKIAGQLADMLDERGLKLFLDSDSLDGSCWTSSAFDQLRTAQAVVILLSTHTQRDGWIKDEVVSALEADAGRPIISILLDSDAKKNWVWPLVASRQVLDVSDGQGSINNVVEAVSAIAAPSIPAPTLRILPSKYSVGRYSILGIFLGILAFVLLVLWLLISLRVDGLSKVGVLLGWFPPVITAFLVGLVIGKLIRAKEK